MSEPANRAPAPALRLPVDWFMAGMAVVTGLAWWWPGAGATGGPLHANVLAQAGVALIFFLYGLTLSFGSLKTGALHWRLHVAVQVCTFLFFPLAGLLLLWVFEPFVTPELRLGFLYLCALPSTISSSVAMTATAGGNVPAAIFNATLSSVIGVVLTPLWMALLAGRGGQVGPLGGVMLNIVCWVLLPMAVGQVARRWLGGWASAHRRQISVSDRLVILLIIYSSMCDSVKGGLWTGHGWTTLATTLLGSTLLFWLAMLATAEVAKAWHFSRPDRIATMFCGSKKTLASGVPMAKLIFGAHPALGVILLPIMIYHPLQLIICGLLAARWRHGAG